jgi:twitching motility protein PilT
MMPTLLQLKTRLNIITHTKEPSLRKGKLIVDVPTFAEALRRALRQDPDVILVGELRDLETIDAAMTAAETGHLVFGTLHTTGAAKTIDRVVNAFPINQQEQIRIQLSTVLQAVISQLLIPDAINQAELLHLR